MELMPIYFIPLYGILLSYAYQQKLLKGFPGYIADRLKKRWYLIVAVSLATVLLVFYVDKPVLDYMHFRRSPLLNWTARLGNTLGKGDEFIFPVGAIAFIVAAYFKRQGLMRIFAVATIAPLVSGLFVQVVKLSFSRARPYKWEWNFSFFNYDKTLSLSDFMNNDYMSMASGDVIVAISFFVTLAILIKHPLLRAIFLTAPIIVGFGRMHIMAHWLSDTLLAMVCGTFISLSIIRNLQNKEPDYFEQGK